MSPSLPYGGRVSETGPECSMFNFTQLLFHSVKLGGCVIRLRARGLIIVSIL